MLQQKALGIGFFLAMTAGCTAAAPHRYASPQLPPMDPEQPAQANSIRRPSIEATPKDEPAKEAAATLEREPGNSSGPCPAPNEAIRRMLANAMAMQAKTTDPGPQRAIAEAVRLRLDELYQHGCFRHLDDEQLAAAVAEIAPDPKAFIELLTIKRFGDLGIWSYYATYTSGALAIYRWQGSMIRSNMIVTGERGDMDKQLMVLSGKIAKLPSHPEPVLVLANSHPWMSSCWRALRIRVLAPSGDPVHPKVLLDKPLSGRWCEGMTTQVKGDMITFGYDGWGGPWSMALVQRPYSLTYQYVNGALVEHFGFPSRLEDLPEDWLMREWNLSREATLETERDRLEPIHEKLHRILVDYEKAHTSGSNAEYSQELFPVSDAERRIALYCVLRDTNKACGHWPKPVDVFIKRQGEFWFVKDVVPRR